MLFRSFTAAAILLLDEKGKLSLDDPVSKFLPELRRSNEVTIRELLTQTSGYRDYFTEEYLPRERLQPTTVKAILKRWGEADLDFNPGTRWAYSNTNYVIAGKILEKVSGEHYFTFLKRELLTPAGILDATLTPENTAERSENAVGYYRFGFGPPREAPRAGPNWLFAMGDLVLTAQDLANWDITFIRRSILSNASYALMSTEGTIKNGGKTGYGMGFFLQSFSDAKSVRHIILHHPGEISGFRAENYIVPDAQLALVILTNAEYSDANTELARRLSGLLGMAAPLAIQPENSEESRARSMLEQLRSAKIDRSILSRDASETFTPQALHDIRQSLLPLGRLQSVKLDSSQSRGGMKHFAFTVKYEMKSFQISEYDLPDGRIEQFMLDDAPR